MFRLKDNVYLEVTKKDGSMTPIYKKIDNISSFSGYAGFTQDVNVQSTDAIDFVTKQTINKDAISLEFVIRHDGNETPYTKMLNFEKWLMQYVDLNTYQMCLIMGYQKNLNVDNLSDPDNGVYYGRRVLGYIDKSTISSLQKGAALTVSCSFQPLSLAYVGQHTASSSSSSEGLRYNYEYNYTYGFSASSNAIQINNGYFKKIPIVVNITSPCEEPTISLSQNGEVYSQVVLHNIVINSGEQLVIDAINLRIYKRFASGSTLSAYDAADKSYDVFLFARPGTSELNVIGSIYDLDNNDAINFDVEYMDFIL